LEGKGRRRERHRDIRNCDCIDLYATRSFKMNASNNRPMLATDSLGIGIQRDIGGLNSEPIHCNNSKRGRGGGSWRGSKSVRERKRGRERERERERERRFVGGAEEQKERKKV
jgi:hypothetical protein